MNKTTFLKSALFTMVLFSSITLSAQSQSETEATTASSQEIIKAQILKKCLDIQN